MELHWFKKKKKKNEASTSVENDSYWNLLAKF